MVQLLIDHGAVVPSGEEVSRSVLRAAYGGHTEMIQILAEAGASVNGRINFSTTTERKEGPAEEGTILRGKEGEWHVVYRAFTPLMLAALQGHTEAVKVLVASGADLTPLNGKGRLAWQVASDEAIAEMLFVEKVGRSLLQDRFVDSGNGTVRDNNTGLIWLKNASCEDLDQDGKATWDEARMAAAALATGTCGLTDGSVAGDWRLPTILEFCSAWSGEKLFPCPSTAAPDSLIDSFLSGAPFVANAAGKELWTEGDPFVGVRSFVYWSATESDASHAWAVFLTNGLVDDVGAKDNNFYVWPVRDGQ